MLNLGQLTQEAVVSPVDCSAIMLDLEIINNKVENDLNDLYNCLQIIQSTEKYSSMECISMAEELLGTSIDNAIVLSIEKYDAVVNGILALIKQVSTGAAAIISACNKFMVAKKHMSFSGLKFTIPKNIESTSTTIKDLARDLLKILPQEAAQARPMIEKFIDGFNIDLEVKGSVVLPSTIVPGIRKAAQAIHIFTAGILRSRMIVPSSVIHGVRSGVNTIREKSGKEKKNFDDDVGKHLTQSGNFPGGIKAYVEKGLDKALDKATGRSPIKKMAANIMLNHFYVKKIQVLCNEIKNFEKAVLDMLGDVASKASNNSGNSSIGVKPGTTFDFKPRKQFNF